MALVQPPMITYNLKERGRKFRGVDRHFDIPVIVNAINSPKCQERVKTRGMLGFFGHWSRIKFGLEPAEGGLVDGKAQAIEPAIVTTHLKAFPDGTIEHKTEFLDNPMGQLVSRMYANKVGGFSSAIDPNVPEFYGFDWVNDPNYSTNRGYDLVLDSVSGGVALDDVLAAEYVEQIAMMNQLLKTAEYREQIALDSANALKQENDELLYLLSVNDTPKINNSNLATIRMKESAATFDSTLILPTFREEKAEHKLSQNDESEYLSLKSRLFNV